MRAPDSQMPEQAVAGRPVRAVPRAVCDDATARARRPNHAGPTRSASGALTLLFSIATIALLAWGWSQRDEYWFTAEQGWGYALRSSKVSYTQAELAEARIPLDVAQQLGMEIE